MICEIAINILSRHLYYKQDYLENPFAYDGFSR